MENIKNCKILIVDDNLNNLQLIGSTLRDEGYKVLVSSSGVEALDVIKVDPALDLILLDVMMPEMDGFEFARQVMQELNITNIPILFITGRTDLEDILKGFELGGVDYITKPFHVPELLARVKTHLRLKKAREEIIELRRILPVCSHCKKIRDDEGVWQQAIDYIDQHTQADLSHGLCGVCVKELYEGEDWYDESLEQMNQGMKEDD